MNNKNLSAVLGIVGIVILIFLGATLLAETKAKEMVDNSIEAFKTNVAASNKQATVTYESLRVAKLTLTPRVSVTNVHVEINSRRSGKTLTIYIPTLEYQPQSFTMDSYLLKLLGDLRVVESKASVDDSSEEPAKELTFKFDSEPQISVNTAGGNRSYVLYFPKTTEMLTRETMLSELDTAQDDDVDTDSGDVSQLIITHDGSGSVQWEHDAQGVLQQQDISVKNLAFSSEGIKIASILSVGLKTDHTTPSEGMHNYQTLFTLDELNFTPAGMTDFNPINVVNEIEYSGPLFVRGAAEQEPGEMKWEVKQAAWESKMLKVYADGNVLYEQADDRLPYGSLTLRVVDLDKFLSYLTEHKPNAKDYLGKVKASIENLAGTKVVAEKPVNLPIVRQKSGHLTIGAMSLEEALATVLGIFIGMPQDLAKTPDLEDMKAGAMPEADDADDLDEEEKASREKQEAPQPVEGDATSEAEEKPSTTPVEEAAPADSVAEENAPEVIEGGEITVDVEGVDPSIEKAVEEVAKEAAKEETKKIMESAPQPQDSEAAPTN